LFVIPVITQHHHNYGHGLQKYINGSDRPKELPRHQGFFAGFVNIPKRPTKRPAEELPQKAAAT
jgi:hypothetical protein